MDQFFLSQRPQFALGKRAWNPPTDIFEAHDSAVILMEVAGATPENLSVVADGRRLTVRGTRQEPRSGEVLCFHLMEVQYGEFERVFQFPFRLSTDEIKATYEHGFLRVEVPKKLEPGEGITVEIDVQGPKES